MILGFYDQFCEYVEDGSKPHSIRSGHRWKIGMRADLYRETRRPKVYEWRRTGEVDCICPEPGMRLACSAGHHHRRVQVAGQRLIFRAPVIRVDPVTIWYRRPQAKFYADEAVFAGALGIAIRDSILSDDEANQFAWRDGFRREPVVKNGPLNALAQMAEFWIHHHRVDRAPFYGQIIHWDYSERFMAITDSCYHITRAQAKQHIEEASTEERGNSNGVRKLRLLGLQ